MFVSVFLCHVILFVGRLNLVEIIDAAWQEV